MNQAMPHVALTPSIELQRSNERGFVDHDWLRTFHSFSFATYHDPRRMQWGVLRVFNEDEISGGSGFPFHPHRNMDILTYVLRGTLEHRDSMGNHGRVTRYGVQYMSAGSGVRHSEVNGSSNDDLHLLQMWVLPRHQETAPIYGQHDFAESELTDKWLRIASGIIGEHAPIRLDADAAFSVARLNPHTTVTLEQAEHRKGFLFVAEGRVTLTSPEEPALEFGAGDAVRMAGAQSLRLTATEQGSHILHWDLAPHIDET